MKKIMIFMVILVLVFTVGSQANADMNDGLVAYYPFSGNAVDASGNNNDGIVYGPSLTEDRFGNTNSAYWFDGKNDWIQVNHSNSLNITDELTISVWIYGESFEGIDTFFHKLNVYGLHYNHLCPPECDNAFNLFLSPPPGSFNVFSYEFFPQPETWYNITATYDGNHVKFYIDGELEKQFNYYEKIRADYSFIVIGGWGQRNNFHGVIDDIRIYNRALSKLEVIGIYWEDLSVSLDNFPRFVETFGLERGIENALVSKIENAQKSIEKGNTKAGINKLEAFIKQVEALKGKKVTEKEAALLINEAYLIIETIDGPPPSGGA